jgi:hypothetical protein
VLGPEDAAKEVLVAGGTWYLLNLARKLAKEIEVPAYREIRTALGFFGWAFVSWR